MNFVFINKENSELKQLCDSKIAVSIRFIFSAGNINISALFRQSATAIQVMPFLV